MRTSHLPTSLEVLPKIPLNRFAWKGKGFENQGGKTMVNIVRNLWHEDQGQDIAEYAVMLAVILVIVVGTIRWWAAMPTMSFRR